MLRKDVTELARESLAVRVMPRKSAFQVETRNLFNGFAAKGISGGPIASTLAEACVSEIKNRVAWARDELKRACVSKGIEYYRRLNGDLAEALDALRVDLWNDATAQFARMVIAVPTWNAREQNIYDLGFQATGNTEILFAKTDLKHFAEQLKTDRSKARWRFVERLFFLVAGIILGAIVTHTVEKPMLQNSPAVVRSTPAPAPTHSARP